MDRKRVASDADNPDSLPPAKHFRPSEDVAAASPPDSVAAADPAQPRPHPTPSNPPEESDNPSEPDPIAHYQRAQLAAKITEQNRDLFWLREKVNELQKLVAVLDAAPRAALYHMHAVREDLTLTLARLGLTQELDPAQSPIAATMLDAEVVTNESLGEIPTALKKLTAQIVLAIEATEQNPSADPERKQANADLHRRVREVSDQLERYAERDKQSLVSSTTFRDEYDDLRLEAAHQRRKIVALELQLREKQENLSAALSIKQDDAKSGDDSNLGVRTEHMKDAADPASNQTSAAPNGELQVAEAAARELSEKRLSEVKVLHEDNKKLVTEVENLRAEVARRDSNVIPIKTILGTALYQTMEATLQQLYLKEKTWQMERDAQSEEREAERKDAEERLEEAKTTAEKSIEDLRRQMEELRRIADAAKVEKDKVVMTYEARKMEAGNAAAVISAAERRANVSEEMRRKLAKSSADLTVEVEKLRARAVENETLLKERGSPDSRALIERLQKDLEDERAKSAGFIQEVESLSNVFGEVETENERLVKLLTEKEQVLSKVMAERLRGRQLLTTIKEENRALTQGRDIDNDKIKSLTAAVAASKKAAAEATLASNKGLEEARALASTLEKRRRIADDSTVALRAAKAEKEEMKRERDAYLVRAEQVTLEYHEDRFQAKRLEEKLSEVEKRVQEAEEEKQASMENGRANNVDSIRDEIIRELRKKLNCSIVTSKPKEVVLLRCGHLFSRQCTDNLIATRNRKCPICGKAFGNDDVRNVFF